MQCRPGEGMILDRCVTARAALRDHFCDLEGDCEVCSGPGFS